MSDGKLDSDFAKAVADNEQDVMELTEFFRNLGENERASLCEKVQRASVVPGLMWESLTHDEQRFVGWFLEVMLSKLMLDDVQRWIDSQSSDSTP